MPKMQGQSDVVVVAALDDQVVYMTAGSIMPRELMAGGGDFLTVQRLARALQKLPPGMKRVVLVRPDHADCRSRFLRLFSNINPAKLSAELGGIGVKAETEVALLWRHLPLNRSGDPHPPTGVIVVNDNPFGNGGTVHWYRCTEDGTVAAMSAVCGNRSGACVAAAKLNTPLTGSAKSLASTVNAMLDQDPTAPDAVERIVVWSPSGFGMHLVGRAGSIWPNLPPQRKGRVPIQFLTQDLELPMLSALA